ncbi:MAG: hypothetical protein KGK07_07420 [Chloroflexota bacterium]|nr:hypothetical protein [Chloroflexota bacterium]
MAKQGGRFEVRAVEGGAEDDYAAYRRGVLVGTRQTRAAAQRLGEQAAHAYAYGVAVLDTAKREVVSA